MGHRMDSGRSLDRWDVLEQAAELARQGEEFALATVVWRQGPSSGHQGSRAIVTADGQIFGWIGGACAEPTLIREARAVIASREPKLLLLGAPDQFGSAIGEGMTSIAIACQSEGAMEVYVEPVFPQPQLLVVGRSPMAHTLVDLARALSWDADLVDAPEFSAADVDLRSVVVVATQGHGDEEAVEQAVAGYPAFVGLVASERRGEAVLGYLAERGVPRHVLDRVRVPVGLDLGHTTHREVAVAILAELVELRAAGGLAPQPLEPAVAERVAPQQAEDPVCGMTVTVDPSSRSAEHDGVTYYFCCPGCRDAFLKAPASYLEREVPC